MMVKVDKAMTVNGNSVWNLFYRSIRLPKNLAIDFNKGIGPPYFWRLCGVYLCLPVLVILAVASGTSLIETQEALIIGAQVALLLPLLFLSIWLLQKLIVSATDFGKEANIKELYWLLATNYFFLLGTPIAIIVLLANLSPRFLNDPIVSFAAILIIIAGCFLWLRSAALLIQSQKDISLIGAAGVAICGAAAITLTAWLVIGLIGLAVLLPIGLSS